MFIQEFHNLSHNVYFELKIYNFKLPLFDRISKLGLLIIRITKILKKSNQEEKLQLFKRKYEAVSNI